MTEVPIQSGPPPIPFAGPALGRSRIDSLDVLRGFALMGILLMNVQSFSSPTIAFSIPSAYGDLTGANWWTWYLESVFVELKFMGMFSMMFGAGIVLMTEHRDAARQPVAGVHYRRMTLLLVFGVLHAYLLWYGDILTPYAICGMAVFLVRRWPPAWLAVAGLGLVIFGSLFHVLIDLGTRFDPDSAQAMRDEHTAAIAAIPEEIEAYRGHWQDHLPLRAEQAFDFQFIAFPFIYFWRIAGLMLLGMALFKWRVLSAARSTGFYVTLAVFGAVIGLPMAAWGAYSAYQNEFDTSHLVGFGALWNWYGSIGVSLMWIALMMLLVRAKVFGVLVRLLGDYGRMAFTNYIGQTVLATLVFYGYGLGLFGSLERVEQLGVVVAIWVVQLAVSTVWLRYFQFGPLEWVWRSGVYLRPQPMLRKAPAE